MKPTSAKNVAMKKVSNPIREYLQMYSIYEEEMSPSLCFKPYKGVSSNHEKVSTTTNFYMFQTL